MEAIWSEVVKAVVAFVFAALVYVLKRAVDAGIEWVGVQAAKHKDAAKWQIVRAAITWAQVKYGTEFVGPDRFKWVMDYLAHQGLTISPQEVETYYQDLRRSGALPGKEDA